MKKIILVILLILALITQKSNAQTTSDTVHIGTYVRATTFADIDHNGFKDMIVNNGSCLLDTTGEFTVIVHMNNGGGAFGPAIVLPYNPGGQTIFSNSHDHDVAAEYDFDHNGLIDIAINCSDYLGIFYQTTPGVFDTLTTYYLGTAIIENLAVDPVTGTIALSHWLSGGVPFFTLATPDSLGGFTFTQVQTQTFVQDFKFENNEMFGRGATDVFEYDLSGNLVHTYHVPAPSTAYDVYDLHISVTTNALTLVEFAVGNTIPTKTSTIAFPLVESMKYRDQKNVLLRHTGIEIIPQSGMSTYLPNNYAVYMHMHSLDVTDLDNDGDNEIIAPLFNIVPYFSGLQIFGLVGGVTTGIEPEPVVQEVKQPSISVYPNPTSDFLYVSNVEENAQFKVISLNGDVALSGSGSIINVGSLSKGIYIIQILDIKNNVSRRFTKL